MGQFTVTREDAIHMLNDLQNDCDLDEEDMQDYTSMDNETLAGELCMSGLFAELTAGMNVYEKDLVVE